MLRLFQDKRRLGLLGFLVVVAAMGPTLMSWFASRSTAISEPNAGGGLTYRDGNPKGIRTYPGPLAAVLTPFPDGLDTELVAETDGTGELRSATIMGSLKGDLFRLNAYYSGPGRVAPAADAKRRYGISIVDLGERPEGRRAYRINVSAL